MPGRFYRLIRKPLSFVGIGGGVFVFGLLLQALLVRNGVTDIAAYTIQLIVTVVMNVDLNRRLTWRDRSGGLKAHALSVVGRICTALVSWPLFLLLNAGLHVPGLAANAIIVAFGMGVNYLMSEKFAYRARPVDALSAIFMPSEIERTTE